MSRNPGSARSVLNRLLASVIAVLLVVSSSLFAQEASTGNVSGTVTGPKGASVSGAEVTLTQRLTGAVNHTTTSPAGTYLLRDLPPADYVLHVEARGFQPAELLVKIQAAGTATGDVRLQRVLPPAAVLVNTRTPEVADTLTSAQMEPLPTNRNFLDLVNLEPGVQLLDGQVLAPSKSGVAAASMVGRNGRTTRTLVDGIDMTDETVGATTQNLPLSAIQELQISQSFLPLSSGAGSAGLVNVVTKSATNDFQGQLLGNFRDQSAGVVNFPGGQDNSYSREVFGGNFGGALRPDKLFFFVSGEYFKQDLFAPVVFNQPFTALAGGYHAPFRETELESRLDYKLSAQLRLFYRFTYDNNRAVNSFDGSNFQVFQSRGNTPSHAVGVDFTRGDYTHSIRFAYNRFSNHIADAVNTAGAFNPAGISLNFSGGSGFSSGPSPFAPGHTIQANKEARYDGSRAWGLHSYHFGFTVNKIDSLVFADLFGLAPQVGSDTGPASVVIAGAGPFPGFGNNPLNYPVNSITLGNGFGCFSEKSAFGSACGGIGDTRVQAYAGDTWKVRPNLTLTYGVQYLRDTGRTDSDLAPVPCSAVAASFGALAPCAGSDNLLNHFGGAPGLGNRVRQPDLNFAPQFGAAWDPRRSGRTVVRAGIGLYYDDSLLHNVLFDREARLASGRFNAQANDPCASHGVVILPGNVPPLVSSDGLDIATQICGNPIGQVSTAIADLQGAFQRANALLSPGSPNPNFLGQTLNNQQGLLAPNFQTPRSVQMNLGFQHQFGQATLLSVDYVRNVGTHYLLGLDTNHVGDAGSLNLHGSNPAVNPALKAALNAINTTLSANQASAANCLPATSPGASSQDAVNCYLHFVPTASIADFASHGLDSGAQFLGGYPASALGLAPDTGAAFPGINPLVGRSTVFFPAGRSLYSAVQLMLRTQASNPARGVRAANFQVSYSHASFRSNVAGDLGDQDLLPLAADFNHPTAFFGAAPESRKHQISLASLFDLRAGVRLGLVGHFASPLPQTLFLPAINQPGEIFRTDVTGDGAFGGQSQTGNDSHGDILPLTTIGAFGHAVSASGLNTVIQNYNSNFAGKLTPAGQALVTADLLTQGQLQALHATLPTIASAPPGNVGLAWLRTLDLTLSRPLRIKDRFTFEPWVSAFNILNFANFDGPGNRLGGVLNGAAGEINGTTAANRAATRTGFGSGVFTLGAPRQLEFGVKVTF